MKHYPMTKEQRENLDHDVAIIMMSLSDIATLLGACYGDKDQRSERAGEAHGAVQRLIWALERQAEPLMTGDLVASVRVQEIVGAGRQESKPGISEPYKDQAP